ncbi:MAG: ribosome silencing factor [Candidatus Margulisbacteria bacterium]|nr:ribosome silencing factor [Candidatus Margulisiibacteriota bacterium]
MSTTSITGNRTRKGSAGWPPAFCSTARWRPRPGRTTIKRRGDTALLDLIAEAAEDKQAVELRVLDVRAGNKLVDYLVLCSGEADTHLRAIEKGIDEALRKENIKGHKWEGVTSSGWLILDLGSIVVHVMSQEARDYYRLEELWGKDAIVYHY